MKKIFLLFVVALLMPYLIKAQNLTATEIVRKSEEKMDGTSNRSEMTMKIVRPTWEREVKFKSWSKGRDYSLTLITAPAKDAGQTFLKQQNDMWNWNPSISRMVKLPASMMSQGWMGSDFSNDDVLNESSPVNDYTHEIKGTETVNSYSCHKIQFTPKAGAAVVWGSITSWISTTDFLRIKTEYYDEEGELVKTEQAYDVKNIGGRMLPSRFEIIPANNKGNKTIVTINSMEFDIAIDDSFFSQQNMKKVR